MSRYVIVFWLAVAFGPSTFYSPQQDTGGVLARSEALYYEARFSEAISLLTPVEESLQSAPDSAQEKANVKFQLALNYFALNEAAKAKTKIAEMCTLDPKCSIDSQKYPPKVLTFFLIAKEDFEKEAAEKLYQQGMDAYRRNEYVNAAVNFREAVRRDPEHSVAGRYLELTRDSLRLTVNQKVLDWRRDFQSGAMAQAATDYRQLQALNVDGIGDAALDEIRTEIRKQMAPSIDTWNRACKSGDALTMNQARTRATEMLPDPAIGQDLLDRMSMCTVKPCVNLDPSAAMLRVKVSGKPEIPSSLQKALKNSLGQTVRVQAKIDENGDVSVLAARGGETPEVNEAVRRAVEKWKFSPISVEGETRCVETVFPIGVSP